MIGLIIVLCAVSLYSGWWIGRFDEVRRRGTQTTLFDLRVHKTIEELEDAFEYGAEWTYTTPHGNIIVKTDPRHVMFKKDAPEEQI